ncbi:LOW QUALITY PROTEIN: hypothetical protein MAR_013410, partial [Mya arenaria]
PIFPTTHAFRSPSHRPLLCVVVLTCRQRFRPVSMTNQGMAIFPTNTFSEKDPLLLLNSLEIDTYTDAFIKYALISIQRHQCRGSEIFKYITIVGEGGGATQSNPFGGCYQYDIQFRLRMANDNSRSWSLID